MVNARLRRHYVTRRIPCGVHPRLGSWSTAHWRRPMAHPQHALPVISIDGEIRAVVRAPARERWSWALYDFANTIFSMNVATLYFSVWLVSDIGASEFQYAVANGIASVMVVAAIPALGAISDT